MTRGSRPAQRAGLLAAALIAAGAEADARAAFPTRVLTAAEPERPLPELHLGVRFRREESRGQITREWFTTGRTSDSGDARPQDVRELDWYEATQYLDITARVGLFRDLELRITAPIVLDYVSEIRFAGGVGPNSTVYAPASADRTATNADDVGFSTRYPITGVPASRSRSGLGDLRFGLAWSPLVETKDLGWPTLTLVGEVTAPTGEIWDPADIDALPGGPGGDVGRGLTVIDLSVGLSKRTRSGAPAFDPYFQLGTRLPIASGAQQDRGMEPPPSARLTTGTELIFHEVPDDDARYALDLGLLMRFIGSGRTYSPLSDYLPSFDQTRVDGGVTGYADYADPDHYRNRGPEGQSCSGVRLARPELGENPDAGPVAATPGVACGELNQVEEHMHLGGRIGLHIQPNRWFMLRAGGELAYITDHLLTNESAGQDTDPPDAPETCSGGACFGRVNARNAQGQDERSPHYDPRYDAPGRRFRLEEAFTWAVYVEALATF